jgi:hypothetical protein
VTKLATQPNLVIGHTLQRKVALGFVGAMLLTAALDFFNFSIPAIENETERKNDENQRGAVGG